MKNNVKDFITGYIFPIIGIIAMLALIAALIIGTGIILRDMNYSSTLKNPASEYEVGEIVNDEYKVVGTDKQNKLWLQKRDEDCTYIAVVSSDYPNLSFPERVKWLWKTSLKDSINIEISEQAENLPNADES